MSPRPQFAHLAALLGLLAVASCGSTSMDPADGSGGSTTDGEASGGSAMGGNATGGDASAAGSGGAPVDPARVGSCHFEDEALAQDVREVLPYGDEDAVLEVSTLSIDGAVTSLEGIGCLTGLTEVLLVRAEASQSLDLAPLGELASLGVLHFLGGQYEHLEVVPTLSLTHLQLTELNWTSLDPLQGADTVEVMWIEHMPATDLSALATFTSLRSLMIEDTDTTDLSPLGSLDALEELTLDDVPVEELARLGEIDHLRALSLYQTPVSSLAGLAVAPELDQLNIQPAPELHDLGGLEGLPSLVTLNISDSPLSDLSALSGSTSLEMLDISNAAVVDLSPLGSCENLGSVRLSGNQIVDLTPLGALGIASLAVDRNQIVDLEPLAGTSIGSLDISENPIGSFEPIGMLEDLVALTMSDVGATSIGFLAGLELTRLIASHNQIEDISVLVGMPLLTLDLNDNSIATLPDDFVGAQGECADTLLEQNPLDAPAKALLEALCESDDAGTILWDGGDCNRCFVLK